MFITFFFVMLLVFSGFYADNVMSIAQYAEYCKPGGFNDVFGDCIYPEQDYNRAQGKSLRAELLSKNTNKVVTFKF